MPPPVLSKPIKPLDEATERVFREAIAAAKDNFPEGKSVHLRHEALQSFIETTATLKAAWPLPPRAALHALGFSVSGIPQILECDKDDDINDPEAFRTQRLVMKLADLTPHDFPAALSWVWEAKAKIWEWPRAPQVKGQGRMKKSRGKGKERETKDEEDERNGEKEKMEEEDVVVVEEKLKKQGVEKKTRVRKRMRPKPMPRYTTSNDIALAVILARQDKEQELKKELEEQQKKEWPERLREAQQALQKAMEERKYKEQEQDSQLEGNLETEADSSSGVESHKKSGVGSRMQTQSPEQELQALVSNEQVKYRKDSKTQARASSTEDKGEKPKQEKPPEEDSDATMAAIMSAAQELGDSSLTEESPTPFDVRSFTDTLLANLSLSRRDPPLHLERSKRFLPTAAQDLQLEPAKIHKHFYHTRSESLLLLELWANYARVQARFQDYCDDCVAAGKTPLLKQDWARKEGVSLEEAFFGDIVDDVLAPDVWWDEVEECLERVPDLWQGVWEKYLRRVWGETAQARADEVFERTDRA